MADWSAHSPLDRYGAGQIGASVVSRHAGVRISELQRQALVRVQAWTDLETLSDEFNAIDLRPPSAGRVTTSAAVDVFWITPREWVVRLRDGNEVGFVQRLREKLAPRQVLLTSIGDSRTTLRVSGRDVRALLAQGSGASFSASAFRSGHAVVTRFAQIPALVAIADREDQAEIFVDRALAAYLWEWLSDAAREFMAP